MPRKQRRRIVFITGTRAESGLMRTTLKAIANQPTLNLKIIATGMHLDPRHGDGLDALRAAGLGPDAIVPWEPANSNKAALARSTGNAIAGIADQLQRMRPDVVLVVGDRVEAFAGATAGHLSGHVIAHVHGGDRAAGQVDDCLRHAISKLSHVHFPATAKSRQRLLKMGEDSWRIHLCGSPGVDGIVKQAATFPGVKRGKFALVLHHPVTANDQIEYRQMSHLLKTTVDVITSVVVIYPNNDPGSTGICRAIEKYRGDPRFILRRDLERSQFLGLMRDATFMIGNSSSGIIEAASFGTLVIDVGPRQLGREHGRNVVHAENNPTALNECIARMSANRFRRYRGANIYGGQNAGTKIADVLAQLRIDDQLRSKLIAY